MLNELDGTTAGVDALGEWQGNMGSADLHGRRRDGKGEEQSSEQRRSREHGRPEDWRTVLTYPSLLYHATGNISRFPGA